MDLGIAEKCAFVAGGSKGMGRATALALAAEGCRVAVVAREQKSIDEAVDEIRQKGGEAVGVSAELATADGVAKAVAAVTDAFGAPEIVVGQTLDTTIGLFVDTLDEDYERIFKIFTMSQIYLARAVLPEMKKRKWGRFIHIGSTCGREPEFSFPHILSNTVRPSTVGFLRTLANEVARDGITVNIAAPGFTATINLENQIRELMGADEAAVQEYVKTGPSDIPAGRAGRPEEIAALVTFLASQHAGYITGEWIAVDGGRHHFAA